MSTIKAPFNFVPLNQTVVIPEWGEAISHDIPFEDAQSGTLEVTIEARSPIFVRDGHKDNLGFFKSSDDAYMIPGSSLRGMFRSVMEIMTFSHMRHVNNHRFAYRDFHNNKLYNIQQITQGVKCGWLQKKNDQYYLTHCGVPGRVSLDEIGTKYSSKIKSFFSEGGEYSVKNDEHKSAKFKYNFLNASDLDIIVRSALQPSTDKKNKYDSRKLFSIVSVGDRPLDRGEQKGTLVMTGQPDARKEPQGKKPSGKIYEFVFWDTDGEAKSVSATVIERMQDAYLDHQKEENQSEDWKWRKGQLEAGKKIPVFFHEDEKGQAESIGLSFLYKFAYDNSVLESIDNTQDQEVSKIDLTSAIFGYTDLGGNKDQALKGRVHIGHAKAVEGTAQPFKDTQSEVLASPKASFYPLYVQQEVRNGKVSSFLTYNDADAHIAGWKRYPVRAGNPTHNKPNAKVKNPDKVTTKFIPLDKGAKFTFRVSYHNLKLIELGALVSALTFHNTRDTYHSLGMAKPLGYGKIKVDVENLMDYAPAMQAFEAYMTAKLEVNWASTDAMTELITMASDQLNATQALQYMDLDKGEFSTAKKDGLALDRYSKLPKVAAKKMSSWASEKDVVQAKENIQRWKTIYDTKRPYQEVIKDYLAEQKRLFEQQLEAKKEELLDALSKRREEVEAERKAARTEANRQARVEAGPDLTKVNVRGRKPFYELRQIMREYFKKGRIENEKLDSAFIPDLEALVIDIFANIRRKRDKEKLLVIGAKNREFQQIASWIGEERAIALWDKLRGIE